MFGPASHTLHFLASPPQNSGFSSPNSVFAPPSSALGFRCLQNKGNKQANRLLIDMTMAQERSQAELKSVAVVTQTQICCMISHVASGCLPHSLQLENMSNIKSFHCADSVLKHFKTLLCNKCCLLLLLPTPTFEWIFARKSRLYDQRYRRLLVVLEIQNFL